MKPNNIVERTRQGYHSASTDVLQWLLKMTRHQILHGGSIIKRYRAWLRHSMIKVELETRGELK
jgi:hypothetical protein